MNPDDIARIRALADRATPGPWEATPVDAWGEQYVELTMQPVTESWDSDPAHACCEPLNAEDAEFIAEARTSVPELLDALEQAEARIKAVLDMHTPTTIYADADSCRDMSDEHADARHEEDTDYYGQYYCLDMPLREVCPLCTDEGGDHVAYPCPTIRALTA